MTAKLPFQIEIPKRSLTCSFGQENLEPHSTYFSTINEDENGMLKRADYCAACWEANKQQLVPSVKTFWKSKIAPKKVEANKYKNRDELALELLKEAVNRNSPEDIAEAYILALYLVRRKLLAFRQKIDREDGALFNLYEIVATEEMIAVHQIALSQLQTESLQQSLAEKLSKK